ncbi:hypothetical protein JIN85_01290 [Luteolibacter pohnpeiensis]|uniref:Uncharacterized protein n=1 Tax=Luteolibacter pohnpeiensis TaxID=454153 RepID=A0A934S5A6_9BACT|nr:N-formylglutamate amidohydrolase [Luteolibacter pohnpeiensis]MBK1881026.1 hypothetical protein [Luteolibacter pohnpeiensis]
MISFLFSCEHATCAIPEAYRQLFRGSEDLVTSPKGWDPGALNLAQGFSMKFRTPLIHGDMTRLLIDLDENGDERWSQISRNLPEATQAKLIDRHERTYRAQLQLRISDDLIRNDWVAHLMTHTVDSEVGKIELLTPPHCENAEQFAGRWSSLIRQAGLEVSFRRAAPLNGLVNELMQQFPPSQYAPVRLEVSQSFFLTGTPWRWETLKRTLITTLKSAADAVQSN